MSRKKAEQALAAWRAAQRRLDKAVDGDRDALEAEVVRQRTLFQQESADDMTGRMDALQEAQARRNGETPSSDQFHAAARDQMRIAAEIWESARISDEDTKSARPRGDETAA